MLTDRALKTNRMSVQSPLVVKISAAGGKLLVENNRQPRLEPDHTIGDCDWGVFENCYLMLSADQRIPREVADDQRWTVHIPLMLEADAAETNKVPAHE